MMTRLSSTIAVWHHCVSSKPPHARQERTHEQAQAHRDLEQQNQACVTGTSRSKESFVHSLISAPDSKIKWGAAMPD